MQNCVAIIFIIIKSILILYKSILYEILEVNEYAVTKLANMIMLLKHLVLQTAGI